MSGEERERDHGARQRSSVDVSGRSRCLRDTSRRWDSTRTFFVLGLGALLVTSFSTALAPSGRAAPAGDHGGLEVAVTPPTPPPSFGCESYGSSILVISPSPARGAAGTVVTLEGSGYYNQVVKGSFTIWMASYSGGSLVSLASIPAPAPEPFWVNVTVPGIYAGVPLPPGPYEFWSLNDSGTDPGCANYPFTLTATNQTTPPTATSSSSGLSTYDLELILLVVILAVIVLVVVAALRRREEPPDLSTSPSDQTKKGPTRPS